MGVRMDNGPLLSHNGITTHARYIVLFHSNLVYT